ncbi:hypothetical protein C8R46DRAFT_1247861 [Mycena filopes]|nr:hypothetical protein C8R46DRAFT_1247861 [Mycena filopes]
MSHTAPPPLVDAPPPENFTGIVDEKMGKPLLQRIAAGMGCQNVNKKKAYLISFIQSSMDRFPATFEDDPRFSGLYKARNKKTKSKSGKSSASKAAEDLQQDALTVSKPLTGANLTLHEQGSTTDPRPGFQQLSLQIQTWPKNLRSARNEEDKEESSDSPLASITETENNNPNGDASEDELPLTSHADDPPELEKKAGALEPQVQVSGTASNKKTATGTVLVRLSHPTDVNHRAEQVAVNNANIIKSTKADGTVRHQVELTELLPLAINNSSPIKADRAGRFSRPGVHNSADVMLVGTVAQHIEGTAKNLPNLLFQTGNRVSLVDHGDAYGCDLFFQPSGVSTTGAAPAPPTQLTGSGSDQPLAIAQARRDAQLQVNPDVPVKQRQEGTPHFYAFLREFAQQDGPLAGERNKTSGQARRSNAQFMPFFNKFKMFDTGAGYHIPATFVAPAWVTTEGWEQYRNRTFTQIQIIEAAGRTSTSTRTNMTLFKTARKILGEIGDWVKSPLPPPQTEEDDSDDNDDESPFEAMALHDFQKLVKEEHRAQQGEKPSLNKSTGHSKSKRDGAATDGSSKKKRKRTPTVNGEKDGESEEERKRRKKEAKREAKRLNSEDLDKESDDDHQHRRDRR